MIDHVVVSKKTNLCTRVKATAVHERSSGPQAAEVVVMNEDEIAARAVGHRIFHVRISRQRPAIDSQHSLRRNILIIHAEDPGTSVL